MNAGGRVIAALEALAPEDVGELLEEVRQEGRSIARRRLTELYADMLVQKVMAGQGVGAVAHSEPAAGHDQATGCYVYAITRGEGASAATSVPGIAPGGRVDVVSAGGMAAVVSDVDVATVRQGCDEADVKVGGWLANAVRAHEQVVTAAFRSAPTIPMRFGIVYPDRSVVVRLLQEYADEFNAELDRLTGRAEWNVWVFLGDGAADNAPADDRAPVQATTGSSSPGVDFLSRERDRRRRRSETAAHARAVIDEIVDRLDDVTLDRTQLGRTTAAAAASAAFAATYLVEQKDAATFQASVDQLQSLHGPDATIRIDGPWPPFHFTELQLESPRG